MAKPGAHVEKETGKDKVRCYLVRGKRASWQPTIKMRKAGFSCKSLGEAGPTAQAEAVLLNAKWDAFRRGFDG